MAMWALCQLQEDSEHRRIEAARAAGGDEAAKAKAAEIRCEGRSAMRTTTGAYAGAATGAVLGSAVPIVGTAVGAIIGGIAGAFFGNRQ